MRLLLRTRRMIGTVMITYQRLSTLNEVNIKMLAVIQVVKDFTTTYAI
jgi:hypothetical protein